MAFRVNADEVKEIIDTSLSDPVIEAFISAANPTVTELLGSITSLSAVQLKEIERWFTAHLIACTRERQIDKETTGQAGATYSGQTEMGLDATMYGQQVKVLDTSGIMAQRIGKKLASVYAIPTTDDDSGIDG